MIRRPLVLALAAVISTAALLPGTAAAEDLLQTYELARTGDPQLSAAESGRLATREGAVQARAAMLPQIGGSASLEKARSEGPGTFQGDPTEPTVSGDVKTDSTTRRAGVQLDQMIFDRSRFTTLRSQNALSRASDFQLESASDVLITRTSAAYFNVLVQLETLAAAEAAEAALQKQFDFASKRLEVGLAPITDVHEARAQFDSARANTILARNAVEDAYQALAEITGQPVRNLQGLPKDFQPVLPESQGSEQWVQSATKNNPALAAKQAQVESTEANIETARSGHWPTLYLGAGYGYNKVTGERTFSSGSFSLPPSPIDSENRGPSVGITLSVPIFSGGAVQSRVRQAIAQRDVASDELEQQKRALVRNTRNAYQTLVAGVSEVEARRLALFSAQSAYDASQVGLEVGTRTVLDVLNNQRNLFTAQQAYALARYNYLQNRLLLEQAAGTLDVADVQDINRLLTVNAEAQVATPPATPRR
ncbi:TolC family outer membrane protein [Lysobacter koreensis]|uniref:Protein CyaE n=1 Tax=Lysobacter koreensis TaxID=266122 RepID=A0ABW2YNP7_9GAMM